MLTNKRVALVSFRPIRLLEICEKQADKHTGYDAVAMASIPMARKYIQNIISIQILEYATKQISYSLYNFKYHIVSRISDD